MSLSYDWDEVFGWIGHDEGYDCSPAGALGYLPRCLYSPLVKLLSHQGRVLAESMKNAERRGARRTVS